MAILTFSSPTDTVEESVIEQRKSRRFELKLPFELIRSSIGKTQRTGETKNISSVGVLVRLEGKLELGEAIEYLVTLPTAPNADRVRIRCLGKVVRGNEHEMAATLERYEFIRESASIKPRESSFQSSRAGARRRD